MKFLKKILMIKINFFKSFIKYKNLENSIATELTNMFVKYEGRPNKEELERLVQLVYFCNRHNINGATGNIKKIILDSWNKQK